MPDAAAVAARLGGRLVRGDPGLTVQRVAPPEEAGEGDVCVLFDDRSGPAAPSLVVGVDPARWPGPFVQVPSARRAFRELLIWLHPEPIAPAGAHPGSIIDPEARIAGDASVGAGAVIEAGARIGAGAVIGPLAYVGPGVEVGEGCRLGPGVRLLRGTRLGPSVRVGAGSVLGERGFGLLPPDPTGLRTAIPQVGGVLVGEGAEIGALVTIDRGTLGDTVIGPWCRLDNLVQVGHNCHLGAHVVLAGQCGVSGSVVIGEGAVLAGQSGVADHRRVGRGATLLARAAAFRDVPDGAIYGGTPARPRRRWLRQLATLSRLARQDKEHNDEP